MTSRAVDNNAASRRTTAAPPIRCGGWASTICHVRGVAANRANTIFSPVHFDYDSYNLERLLRRGPTRSIRTGSGADRRMDSKEARTTRIREVIARMVGEYSGPRSTLPAGQQAFCRAGEFALEGQVTWRDRNGRSATRARCTYFRPGQDQERGGGYTERSGSTGPRAGRSPVSWDAQPFLSGAITTLSGVSTGPQRMGHLGPGGVYLCARWERVGNAGQLGPMGLPPPPPNRQLTARLRTARGRKRQPRLHSRSLHNDQFLPIPGGATSAASLRVVNFRFVRLHRLSNVTTVVATTTSRSAGRLRLPAGSPTLPRIALHNFAVARGIKMASRRHNRNCPPGANPYLCSRTSPRPRLRPVEHEV